MFKSAFLSNVEQLIRETDHWVSAFVRGMVTTYYRCATFNLTADLSAHAAGLEMCAQEFRSFDLDKSASMTTATVRLQRKDRHVSADSPRIFKTLTAQMHRRCRDGVAFFSYEAVRQLSGTTALEEIAPDREKGSSMIVEASRCRSNVGNYSSASFR